MWHSIIMPFNCNPIDPAAALVQTCAAALRWSTPDFRPGCMLLPDASGPLIDQDNFIGMDYTLAGCKARSAIKAAGDLESEVADICKNQFNGHTPCHTPLRTLPNKHAACRRGQPAVTGPDCGMSEQNAARIACLGAWWRSQALKPTH
jgi:hypothetical protein